MAKNNKFSYTVSDIVGRKIRDLTKKGYTPKEISMRRDVYNQVGNTRRKINPDIIRKLIKSWKK